MKIGICNLPLIPLRIEPSERAEMISQILYGELVDILEEQPGWVKVQLQSDAYSGWCTAKMIQELPTSLWQELSRSRPYVTSAVVSHCHSAHGQLLLPAGSRLYGYLPSKQVFTQYKSSVTDVIQEHWTLSENLLPGANGEMVKRVQAVNPSILALRFMNAPYLWGGKSVFGIDCSGLVQVVFSMTGHFLPRDAKDQALKGRPVSRLEEARPGDLAFFTNPEGRIVHVGIVFKDQQIIHASGSVHIDQLDETGIFSASLNKYTHQLHQLRRI
ncbi:MAG: C40 family peptidase [Bacteroidota bacterium]|nr:C40 family peptidase [Bacteroidota bacterium]